jgi:hypothetical protein
VLVKKFQFLSLLGILILFLQTANAFACISSIDNCQRVDNLSEYRVDFENSPLNPSHTDPIEASGSEKESDSSEGEDSFLSVDWMLQCSNEYFSVLIKFLPGNFPEDHTPPPEA